MATFEGPLLATKTLNSIVHFTDWIVAHAHLGTLGWNGFMTFGIIYWLIEKLWNTKLFSLKLANIHFWMGTLGIVLYIMPMYFGSVKQAEILKAFKLDGTLLHKNFIDSVIALKPFYIVRFIGGSLYLIGAFIMIYNIYKTIQKGYFINNEMTEAPTLLKSSYHNKYFHNLLERKPIQMTILSLIVVAIGGIIEIIPTLVIKSNIPIIKNVKPYTPLELEGRDIYIKENCNSCHSQQIRPFRDEVVRYGEYSKAGEFIYDHPFLWGSKRTGPDLSREGGKNPSSWHYKHMLNPRSTSPNSIMPKYPWLIFNELDRSNIQNKMKTLVKLGVPYTKEEIKNAYKDMDIQSNKIVLDIYNEATEIKKEINIQKQQKGSKFIPLEKREIIALIAYLQRLGKDIKIEN